MKLMKDPSFDYYSFINHKKILTSTQSWWNRVF